MKKATQLSIFLENKPGTLAKVCKALAEDGINIYALTVSDTYDHAVVRMILSDPVKALEIFENHGVLVIENEVLMIEGKNRPGELSHIAEALAAAGANIEYAYLASSPESDTGIMILRANNIEKAFQALASLETE